MANGVEKRKKVESLQGEWLAREPDGWRVRVPTANGHGFFRIAEYGSSTKAYEAARKFQIKMYQQYRQDLEYKQKHGELPGHETINIRNRSGISGVARVVHPNFEAPPRIEYIVSWMETIGGLRVQKSKYFNSANFVNEAACKKAAIELRAKMKEKNKLKY